MRIHWRSTPVVVALAIGLVACSGDDPAVPSTLPVPTTETIASTTATSTPPPSASSTATVPTSSSTAPASPPGSVATIPLTVPPVTTTPLPDDLTDEERAVIEAVQHNFELYNAARLDPTDDAAVTAARQTMSGAALARFEEIIDGYRMDGRRAVTLSALPARLDIDPKSVAVGTAETGASVGGCWLNSNILVETAANAGGSDRVLDDSISSERLTYVFGLADQAGLITDIVIEHIYEGAATCAE